MYDVLLDRIIMVTLYFWLIFLIYDASDEWGKMLLRLHFVGWRLLFDSAICYSIKMWTLQYACVL